MTDTRFDFLVFIGRFQPFHLGHQWVIETALARAEQVIVLCGSAHQPRSLRNPWNTLEREAMIRGAFSEPDNRRLHIAPLMDSLYNDEAWVKNVQATVNGLVTAHHGFPHRPASIGLVGHNKDHSSYYLNLFPQWGSLPVANLRGISSTPLRESLFSGQQLAPSQDTGLVPVNVRQSLENFRQTDTWIELQAEQEFINRYRQSWQAAPYAPTFVTVDALVIQSGHVLMVERKARPGKGLLALPGGFLDPGEKLVDACLRELREETRLRVPAPVLRGSIKAQQVFDDPYRSSRGRTITQVFYMELAPGRELPRVKGGDDARHAIWIPLAELDPRRIFEDHYFIIQAMTGL